MATLYNPNKKRGLFYMPMSGGTGRSTTPPGPAPLAQIDNLNSMEFDGASDFIDCGDSDILSFGNGTTDSPFSVSGWVKPDSLIRFKMVAKYDIPNYEFQFGTGGNKILAFTLYSQNTTDRIQRFYNTILTSTAWQHWVATYDGSGNPDNIKIYINGVQVGDLSSTTGTYTAMQNTIAPLFIGKAGNLANGKIDEVGIFNVALTDAEILSIYNATAVVNGINKTADLSQLTTPPIAWYRM